MDNGSTDLQTHQVIPCLIDLVHLQSPKSCGYEILHYVTRYVEAHKPVNT